MSQYCIVLMLLFYFHHTVSATLNPNATDTFLKAECKATLYPSLCLQCLSTYSKTIQTSRKQLAQAALSVSLSRAQSASTFISKMARMKSQLKPIEYRAVVDCSSNMANSVDQLSRSLKELADTGEGSNAQSWVAAALTFENTCLDGFTSPMIGARVKLSVSKRVVDCKQVTSIALALTTRYAAAMKNHVGADNMP